MTEVTSSVDVPTQAADVVSMQAAEELAWSHENPGGEPLVRRSWRSVWARAGLLVLCGVMAAVAVVVVLRDQHRGSFAVPSTQAALLPPVPPAALPTPIAAPTQPPMRADDQAFLGLLARDGLPPPASISAAIAMAADVCGAVKHGTAPDEVASWLVPPKGSFTQEHAEAFVADALRTYCPHAAI